MIFSMIKAICTMFAQGFSYAETRTEHQCETDVLKTKKKQEKQNGKQEDLLIDMARLLEKYKPQMKKADRIKVNTYIRRIKGVN